MISGSVRDYSPRVRLTLPGQAGDQELEFVVDTGFEGEMALSDSVVRHLDASGFGTRLMFMADRTLRECSICYIELDWDDDLRTTEVLILEGNPLIGMYLLDGHQIHIDATEGGEVTIEPF
jgi:clan AA aspartic protease